MKALLHSPSQVNFILGHIKALPLNDGVLREVVVREVKRDKTLRQLGAIFGCWVKYLAEKECRSEKQIYRELKMSFLARIYIVEPANNNQELWVDALYYHQEKGNDAKVEETANKISLSWATLEQTKEFMNQVDRHYMDIGEPLPLLDPAWRNLK